MARNRNQRKLKHRLNRIRTAHNSNNNINNNNNQNNINKHTYNHKQNNRISNKLQEIDLNTLREYRNKIKQNDILPPTRQTYINLVKGDGESTIKCLSKEWHQLNSIKAKMGKATGVNVHTILKSLLSIIILQL